MDEINEILQSRGFTDYKWLHPKKDIFVEQWVRFKCMFGCNEYGKRGTCPPAVPSVDECRQMIHEYENALILHFKVQTHNMDDIHKQMADLLALEREIFLAGYYKAFLLPQYNCLVLWPLPL